MKLRLIGLTALAILFSAPAFPTTLALSTAVTGAPDPATTGVMYNIGSNRVFEVMGVIPVVSTVTGTPASMAAGVNVGAGAVFNPCGPSTPVCNNELWAAQWTIVSGPTGIQAVNAYQGTSVRLVNTSGGGLSVQLHCQVGQMTGSCIFVTRQQLISEPLF